MELKELIDLSNNDKSYFSIPTGQSGHLFSKHYDDFTELWLKGEYLQIYLDDDPIKHTNGSLMRFIRKIN